jgi:hypothetical protein
MMGRKCSIAASQCYEISRCISVASIAIVAAFNDMSILDVETQLKFWEYLNGSPGKMKNHTC